MGGFEPGKVFMIKGGIEIFGAPAIVLTWASEFMKLYPWMMRVSHLLHRLVQ
jgi:hypothetical protein